MDCNKDYKMLYLKKKEREIYPDNPDGESKAKLEMFTELQKLGFDITCFTDIELKRIDSPIVMKVLLKYYSKMESIFTKETILKKTNARLFPEVNELAMKEYIKLSPYEKMGMTGLQEAMCHGKKSIEHIEFLYSMISTPDDYACGVIIRDYLLKNDAKGLQDYSLFYAKGVLLPSVLKELSFYNNNLCVDILFKCLNISEVEIKTMLTNQKYNLCVTMQEYYENLCTPSLLKEKAQKLLKTRKAR